ncbi:unnamed protein product [Angiostrongylus costaricensis]|uniref:Ovule protein n=1 Tax=Angiostrongylus costaricensis TaxID=334426 RepID=A0A0R3PD86_ANGCS|nr:unnamed protein product [Angiostrongylus costaricensis]
MDPYEQYRFISFSFLFLSDPFKLLNWIFGWPSFPVYGRPQHNFPYFGVLLVYPLWSLESQGQLGQSLPQVGTTRGSRRICGSKEIYHHATSLILGWWWISPLVYS